MWNLPYFNTLSDTRFTHSHGWDFFHCTDYTINYWRHRGNTSEWEKGVVDIAFTRHRIHTVASPGHRRKQQKNAVSPYVYRPGFFQELNPQVNNRNSTWTLNNFCKCPVFTNKESIAMLWKNYTNKKKSLVVALYAAMSPSR